MPASFVIIKFRCRSRFTMPSIASLALRLLRLLLLLLTLATLRRTVVRERVDGAAAQLLDVAPTRELLDACYDLLRAVEALELNQVRSQTGNMRGRCPRQQLTFQRGVRQGEGAPIDVPEIVLVLLVLLPPVGSIHALVIAVPGARMSTTARGCQRRYSWGRQWAHARLPKLLDGARRSLIVVLPTVMAVGSDAGEWSFASPWVESASWCGVRVGNTHRFVAGGNADGHAHPDDAGDGLVHRLGVGAAERHAGDCGASADSSGGGRRDPPEVVSTPLDIASSAAQLSPCVHRSARFFFSLSAGRDVVRR